MSFSQSGRIWNVCTFLEWVLLYFKDSCEWRCNKTKKSGPTPPWFFLKPPHPQSLILVFLCVFQSFFSKNEFFIFYLSMLVFRWSTYLSNVLIPSLKKCKAMYILTFVNKIMFSNTGLKCVGLSNFLGSMVFEKSNKLHSIVFYCSFKGPLL